MDKEKYTEETIETIETITEDVKALAEEIAEETPKKKKGWWIALIILGAIFLIGIGVYFGFAKYYEDRFFLRTSVNGSDCAGMTVEEVETIMQEQIEQYVLAVIARDGFIEEMKASDIGIQYNGINVVREAFDNQNPYLWFVGLYDEADIQAEIDFTYDEALLEKAIGELVCLQEENQKAPVSAKPIYENGAYTIQEESYGSKLDAKKVKTAIFVAVDHMAASIDLDREGCYVAPKYTKDSPEVIEAKDALNKCLETNITYSLDDITVHVNADIVIPWLSVDKSMNLVVDAEQVRTFTDALASKYYIPDSSDEITTPSGRTATVPGGRLGRVVGAAAECNQLIEEIKAGTQTVREPILTQKATPEGEKSWGDTYIEVDIKEQHMWYIENGEVKFESDVVTGKPDGTRNTPVGKFQILEKLRNKTLRGNIMPNGKPEYVTPVKYWARVTWSGIGFHDATWQPGFGGDLYKTIGSHGCINMPLGAVKELYSMIETGTAVVIHK